MLVDRLIRIFHIVNNMKILNYTDRYFFLHKLRRRVSEMDEGIGRQLKIRPTNIGDLRYEQ